MIKKIGSCLLAVCMMLSCSVMVCSAAAFQEVPAELSAKELTLQERAAIQNVMRQVKEAPAYLPTGEKFVDRTFTVDEEGCVTVETTYISESSADVYIMAGVETTKTVTKYFEWYSGTYNPVLALEWNIKANFRYNATDDTAYCSSATGTITFYSKDFTISDKNMETSQGGGFLVKHWAKATYSFKHTTKAGNVYPTHTSYIKCTSAGDIST